MFSCTGYNSQIPNIIQRIEVSGRLDTYSVDFRVDTSGIHHPVLSFKGTGNISRSNTTSRHDGGTEDYINRRRLHAVDFHFCNVFHLQHLIFNQFRLIFEFPI